MQVTDDCPVPLSAASIHGARDERSSSPGLATTNTYSTSSSAAPLPPSDSSGNRTISAISKRLSSSEDLNTVKSVSSRMTVKLSEAKPMFTYGHVCPLNTSSPSVTSIATMSNNCVPFRLPDISTSQQNLLREFSGSATGIVSAASLVQVIDLTKAWPGTLPASPNSLTRTTAQAVQLQAAAQQLRWPTIPNITSVNSLPGTRRMETQVDPKLLRNGSRSLPDKGDGVSVCV